MVVKIGIKRHRIDLERAGRTQTTTGDLTKTWVRFARVWADVIPLRGAEAIQAQQTTATVTHSIRMRRTPESATLTPADRVKFGRRIFELTSVVDIGERRREIEATGHEITA